MLFLLILNLKNGKSIVANTIKIDLIQFFMYILLFYYFYNLGFNFIEFVENKNSLNLLLYLLPII